MRERIVELTLATILVVALSTELLSAFHCIHRSSIAVTWLLLAAM